MKKQAQLGLVVEGKSATSAVLRLPTVSEELGPVKSSSLRVARRLSNMLHAGYAVAEYEELQAARIVLLRVPDSAVPRIVDELCSSGLDFRGTSFVLCETWLTAESLESLRDRGAAVATLVSLATLQSGWFAIEGQISSVRQVRRFLERNNVRGLEIRQECKPLLFGAELLTTVLPLPLFSAAQQALRACGISGNPLSVVLDQMARKMSDNFSKGSRLLWGGPLNECAPEIAKAHLEHVRQTHPEIAQIIDHELKSASRKCEVE